MLSHEFSCRYTLEKTIKMLYKDSEIDEFDEEDKPKVLQERESESSSDKDLCNPDDAGSCSDNDNDDKSLSLGQ